MKPTEAKKLLQNVLNRGWVRDGNKVYTPDQAAAMNIKPSKAKRRPNAKRTGWIDDDLNIRNKAKQNDLFMKLISIELGLDVWPEFYFTVDQKYRFDWAIPVGASGEVLKIAIEQDGGIWMKGGGAHSRPENIERDIHKSTLANVDGWTLIRRTPGQLQTKETIELIKKAVDLKKVCHK